MCVCVRIKEKSYHPHWHLHYLTQLNHFYGLYIQIVKDMKSVFRCLSYLHFDYLVNASMSQMCAKSWASYWPFQGQHGTLPDGPYEQSMNKGIHKHFWEPVGASDL